MPEAAVVATAAPVVVVVAATPLLSTVPALAASAVASAEGAAAAAAPTPALDRNIAASIGLTPENVSVGALWPGVAGKCSQPGATAPPTAWAGAWADD